MVADSRRGVTGFIRLVADAASRSERACLRGLWRGLRGDSAAMATHCRWCKTQPVRLVRCAGCALRDVDHRGWMGARIAPFL